jgi:NAD-dependent SIR2 family protein deacetylase
MRIFISYSLNDNKYAHTIAHALKEYHHEVYYVGDKLNPKITWFDDISMAIQNSDIIIALVTENFLSSSWGNFELGAVFATHSSRPLIPVIFGEITPPSFLMQWQYLKIDNLTEGINRIISAVEHWSQKRTENLPQLKKNVDSEAEYLNEKIAALHKALSDNRLSLVCGAGISKSSDIPEWDTLFVEILKDAQLKLVGGDSNQFDSMKLLEKLPKSNLIIARMLKGILQDDFSEKIREKLYAKRKDSEKISDIMKAIVKIAKPKRTGKRLDSIITLNFDDIIEQSLKSAGVDFCSIWKEGQICEVESLPIYHVHGFLPMCEKLDEPNLVFGEDSYHTQYVDPFVWSNLIQLISFSSNVCLFIGLSLNDPNIRRLLDYSQRKNKTKKHFIIFKAFTQESNIDKIASMLIEQDALTLGLNVIWIKDFERIPEILDRILQ